MGDGGRHRKIHLSTRNLEVSSGHWSRRVLLERDRQSSFHGIPRQLRFSIRHSRGCVDTLRTFDATANNSRRDLTRVVCVSVCVCVSMGGCHRKPSGLVADLVRQPMLGLKVQHHRLTNIPRARVDDLSHAPWPWALRFPESSALEITLTRHGAPEH